MRRNSKTVTIQDVARASGVSVSTVSRALNGKRDVAQNTLEKIQKVIYELGYASSLAARSMRSHRTNVIGLIMPEVATPYSQVIMRGVNHTIAKYDKELIIYTKGGLKEDIAQHERSYVGLLNGGIADGVIVVTPTATDFPTHAPVVFIDPNNQSPDFPGVFSTNREGALAAMDYLIGLGHRRIAHITGRMELVSSNQRLQGYKDRLCTAGIPVKDEYIETGDYTSETAFLCASKLLALPDRPTAIFAANDMAAFGVYQAAQKAGLRIPQDLSVIGFDNLRDSSFLVPPLTSIDQSLEEMGAIATEMIVKLVNDEMLEIKQHVISTELVIRESCQAPCSLAV